MQKNQSITSRSSYDWELVSEFILFIEDLNVSGKMSVTNNIENVLQEIAAELPDPLDRYSIIYRDSQGIIDGVETNNNRYTGIFSVNEKTLTKAIAKLEARKEAATNG